MTPGLSVKRNGTRIAIFSLDKIHRYYLADYVSTPPLDRIRRIVFLMLNPSTADHMKNDPTVAKIIMWAKLWGYDHWAVMNAFAFRATQPRDMLSAGEAIGPLNDRFILTMCGSADLVVCGWGTHGEYLGRGNQVLAMLRGVGIRPHALHRNKDGSPGHPLYLRNSTVPFLL